MGIALASEGTVDELIATSTAVQQFYEYIVERIADFSNDEGTKQTDEPDFDSLRSSKLVILAVMRLNAAMQSYDKKLACCREQSKRDTWQ